MDTRLKDKITMVGWMLLLTFGLSGVFPFLSHDSFPSRQIFYYVYVICGIAAFVTSLFWLKKTTILDSIDDLVVHSYYRRIPIDASTFAVLILCLMAGSKLTGLYYTLSYNGLQWAKGFIVCTVLVSVIILHIRYVTVFAHSVEDARNAWQGSLIYKIRTAIYESFLMKSTGIQMTLVLGVAFASGFGLMVVLTIHRAIVLYVPLFILVTMPTLFFLYRKLGYLNRIVQSTARLADGNVEPDLPVRGMSTLGNLAESVNAIKKGVQSSMAEQAKSERLKTELITNVSHDLRTPLTSIITYTELLKTPDMTSETKNLYIDIIDRKSKRLKVLIDDLFEASKMASGSVELVKERVDMTQLLQQALAENDELITQSNLTFRVTTPESPVYCNVDGQKLWRVFDNLISNIVKYSLENTRVHIKLGTSHGKAVLTFKNVTKYELSENVDELFERFKRGDTSRHTDGSGLGLAIAKSIVDLHGGSLDIAVDGDLYKATVTLSCAG